MQGLFLRGRLENLWNSWRALIAGKQDCFFFPCIEPMMNIGKYSRIVEQRRRKRIYYTGCSLRTRNSSVWDWQTICIENHRGRRRRRKKKRRGIFSIRTIELKHVVGSLQIDINEVELRNDSLAIIKWRYCYYYYAFIGFPCVYSIIIRSSSYNRVIIVINQNLISRDIVCDRSGKIIILSSG